MIERQKGCLSKTKKPIFERTKIMNTTINNTVNYNTIAEVLSANQREGINSTNVAEILAHSGLANWCVKQAPVQYQPRACQENGDEYQVLPGNYVNYRSDNGYAFPNIVKKRYTIVQNESGFSFLENVAGLEHISGGTLASGCYVMGSFGTMDVLGDTVKNYCFFKNSFDGTTRFIVALTPIRVSDNTVLNIAAASGMFAVGVKHTPTVNDRLALAKNILGHQQKSSVGVVETARKAYDVKIGVTDVEDKIREIVRKGTPQRVKGVDNNVTDEVLQDIMAHYYSSDIVRFVGTAYGIILAVAKYASNEVVAHSKNKELGIFNKCLLSPNPLVSAAVKILLP
jgi:hypothetical protein